MNLSPLLFLAYNQLMNVNRTQFIPSIWFVCLLLFSVTACATPTTPAVANAPAANATATSSAIAPTRIPIASPTASMTNNTPAANLQRDLKLADDEMRAAQQATTIAEAKQHAEAVANILVGIFGRWYGDQDRDGTVRDPSDQRGVLPGERVPQPAPDVGTPVFPYGWAMLAHDAGDDHAKQVVRDLLGDFDMWRSQPRAGYDQVQSAVSASDAQGSAIKKELTGNAPRALAWARFILTRAQSLDDARSAATQGARETSAALQSALTTK